MAFSHLHLLSNPSCLFKLNMSGRSHCSTIFPSSTLSMENSFMCTFLPVGGLPSQLPRLVPDDSNCITTRSSSATMYFIFSFQSGNASLCSLTPSRKALRPLSSELSGRKYWTKLGENSSSIAAKFPLFHTSLFMVRTSSLFRSIVELF